MGALLALLLGWNIHASIAVSAAIVLACIALGGLTSAIYNEVLQFFLIVFGFMPVAYSGFATWADGRSSPRALPAVRARMVEPGTSRRESDGRRVVRNGDGSRLRSVFRVLVHRLPRCAACHGCRLDECRATDALIAAVPKCCSRSW